MSGLTRYRAKVRYRAAAKQAQAQADGVFGVTVSVDLSPLEAAVMEALDAAEDWSDFWPVVGDWYAMRQRRVFETGSFRRWTALRASTVKYKRKHSLPLRPLIASGRLLLAVSSSKPRNSGKRFAVFGQASGNGGPAYAKYHARGTGSMPKRTPVPNLTQTERKLLYREAQARFMERAEDASARA